MPLFLKSILSYFLIFHSIFFQELFIWSIRSRKESFRYFLNTAVSLMEVFLTKPLDTLILMIQLFPFPKEMDPFIPHHIGLLIHIPLLNYSFITYKSSRY